MLTKTKQQIADQAYMAAKNAIYAHAANGYNTRSDSLMGQINDLIAVAVRAGIKEALDSIYTNDDFNKDIGL